MRTESVFALLLFVIAAAAEFECPGEGIYPDPDDCRSFYMCSYDQGGNSIAYPGLDNKKLEFTL